MVCFVAMVTTAMVSFSCLHTTRVLILKKENRYYYQLLKMKNIDENLTSLSLTLTHLTDIVVVAYVSSNDSVKQEDFLGTISNSVFTVAAASVGDF